MPASRRPFVRDHTLTRPVAAAFPSPISFSLPGRRRKAGSGRDRDDGRCPGRDPVQRPIRGAREATATTKHTDRRTPESTILIHFFGRGLVDEGRCYAVERFVGLSNGDIRRRPAKSLQPKKVRGWAKPEVATFDEVRELRPAYNEIIVCTALGSRAGVQYWG